MYCKETPLKGLPMAASRLKISSSRFRTSTPRRTSKSQRHSLSACGEFGQKLFNGQSPKLHTEGFSKLCERFLNDPWLSRDCEFRLSCWLWSSVTSISVENTIITDNQSCHRCRPVSLGFIVSFWFCSRAVHDYSYGMDVRDAFDAGNSFQL